MEFGVVLQPTPPSAGVVAMMKRAEAAGFGYGWTFDSHVLWQETFVLYPRIPADTAALVGGPGGNHPGTPGRGAQRVSVAQAKRNARHPNDRRLRPGGLGPPVHRAGPGDAVDAV